MTNTLSQPNTHAQTHNQKKTLSFGNLNATQIFLPEEKIQSLNRFCLLEQLVFTVTL